MSVKFEGEAAIRDAPTWRGHFNATANLVIASTLTREHAEHVEETLMQKLVLLHPRGTLLLTLHIRTVSGPYTLCPITT